LAPHLDKLGLEVIGTNLVSVGQKLVVRFTIDKLPDKSTDQVVGDSVEGDRVEAVSAKIGSSITVDDCAALSKIISDLLDELDPDPGPEYSLEVSSPGLDRPLHTLADFERFKGCRIKLKLGPEGQASRHTGILATDPLRILTDRGEIPFSLDLVKSARLIPDI
jgi:ribosome maturation factor RimP